jgi:PEGA domain
MDTRLWRAAAIFSTALAVASCIFLPAPGNVTFASDPPGARVLIDGKDTGFVTPCYLALDRKDDTRLDVQLPGYVTATRYLTPDHQCYAILWREMYVDERTFHFPLWLNVRDFFVPIKYEKTMAPGRIFVRLERSADAANHTDKAP